MEKCDAVGAKVARCIGGEVEESKVFMRDESEQMKQHRTSMERRQ